MSVINITRFICEYLNEAPLAAMDAFLVQGGMSFLSLSHLRCVYCNPFFVDMITLLVELILKKPWIRTRGDNVMKFEGCLTPSHRFLFISHA